MSSKYRTDVRAERYSRSDELDRLWRGQTAGTTTLITKLTLEQSRREKVAAGEKLEQPARCSVCSQQDEC